MWNRSTQISRYLCYKMHFHCSEKKNKVMVFLCFDAIVCVLSFACHFLFILLRAKKIKPRVNLHAILAMAVKGLGGTHTHTHAAYNSIQFNESHVYNTIICADHLIDCWSTECSKLCFGPQKKLSISVSHNNSLFSSISFCVYAWVRVYSVRNAFICLSQNEINSTKYLWIFESFNKYLMKISRTWAA